MPKFLVNFSKEIEVTVDAESQQEAEEAAEAEVDDNLRDWDGCAEAWSFNVWKIPDEWQKTLKEAEFVVHDGRILNKEDAS